MRPRHLIPWRSASAMAVLAAASLVPFNFMPNAAVSIGRGNIPLHFFIFVPAGAAMLGYAVWWSAAKKRLPAFVAASMIVAVTMAISAAAGQGGFSTGGAPVAGFLLRCVALGWFAYVACAEGESDWFSAAMAVLGAVIALAALYEPLTGHFFIFKREITAQQHGGELWEPWRRIAVGAVGQPLPLSALLNMFLAMALWEWRKRKRWAWAIPAALIFLAILLTYRRSGYAIALATVAAFTATLRDRRTVFAALAGAFVLFTAAVLAVPASRIKLLERFDPAATAKEIRYSHRTRVYGVVAKIAAERPLLGLGPRQYEKRYTDFAAYPEAWDTPDNQYLRFLAEGGVLGLSAFLGLIASMLVPLWKRRAECAPFLVATAAFAASLLLFDGLFWPAPSMAFFAVAGAGLGRLESTKEMLK